MIEGVGVDIVSHRRIKRVLERYGERFLKRVMAESELEELRKRADVVGFVASRWAAKEAVVKALGCSVSYRLIEVLKDEKRPWVRIEGIDKKIHLSLSHEKDYSIAFAVVEGSSLRG